MIKTQDRPEARDLSDRMRVIGDKYATAHGNATTRREQAEARDEYERDVNEAIHGFRGTTAEMLARFGGTPR